MRSVIMDLLHHVLETKRRDPDRDYAQTVAEIPKIRDLARRELYVVQSRIVAPGATTSNR
jgi:hypothetical protein